jgi:hypothetical protein
MDDLTKKFDIWLDAKKAEKEAVEARREIEDELIKIYRVQDDLEGTLNLEAPGHKVKIVGRMNRKVDGDKLQEIAAEHGLEDLLSTLFSWKPSIIMSAWKHSDDSITKPLLGGITTTPGRPSFTITKE